MNHKGYIGVLRVDQDAGVLRGHVVNTRDTITFQGTTVEEATAAFRDSVDDYLKFCESLGEAPEKPFSGKIMLRIRPEHHRALSAIAQSRGTSVNKVIARLIARLARRAEGHGRLGVSPPAKAASTVIVVSKKKARGKDAQTSQEKGAGGAKTAAH